MISHSLFLTTVILILGVTDSNHSTHSCSNRMRAVTQVVNSLGSRLEQRIDKSDNYFISPISITLALAMVYIGARGNTRQQMSEVLQLDAIGQNCLPNKVSENFRELVQSLKNDGDEYSLLIANAAFVQTGREVTQYYASNLEKYFNSKIQFLDFAENDIATIDAINKWVANSTRNKIPKLLNEPLDPLTVMVLVNAVYFKGLWDLPFDEKNTYRSFFYGTNDTRKPLLFMTLQDKVHYYYDERTNYYFLELEYTQGNISMILILPKNKDQIPDYTLTSELLCHLREKFELRTVNIHLPKFSMAYKRELSKDMINLGMVELFSDGADLSGIDNDLHVSLMVHKAVIDINEAGSEASAISGVGIDGRLKVPQKETFMADHPFSFYIVHRETDTVLFSGRLVNP